MILQCQSAEKMARACVWLFYIAFCLLLSNMQDDKSAAESCLFLLQIGERRFRSISHTPIAIVREPLERSDCRWCGRDPQCLDRNDATRRGLAAEEAAPRLRELDECLD